MSISPEALGDVDVGVDIFVEQRLQVQGYVLHVRLAVLAGLHEIEGGKSLGVKTALVKKDGHHGHAHDFALSEDDFFFGRSESLALGERADIVEAGLYLFECFLAAFMLVVEGSDCLEIFRFEEIDRFFCAVGVLLVKIVRDLH